jgi:hypothetical protein
MKNICWRNMNFHGRAPCGHCGVALFFLSIIQGALQGTFDRQPSDRILLIKTQLVVR